MIAFLVVSWHGKRSLSRQFFVKQFKAFAHHLIGVPLEFTMEQFYIFSHRGENWLDRVPSLPAHVHTFPHKRQIETNFGTLILQVAL